MRFFRSGRFERELFFEFWKTLRCLWFCGTKTYHKVLAHPSHLFPVRVDTFGGFCTLRHFGSLLLDHSLFMFQRVCDQANLH